MNNATWQRRGLEHEQEYRAFFFLVNLPITVRQPFIDMAYTQTNMLTQLTDRPTNR